MPTRALSRCGRVACVLALLAIVVVSTLAPRALAQVAPGDTVPSRRYFNLAPMFSEGDYRAALAAYAAETRSGIKIPGSSWIDSICYLTMAGECYYQLGQLKPALDSYDAAL